MQYEMTSKLAVSLSKALLEVWVKLGRPNQIDSPAAWVVVDNIIEVWSKYYPQELYQWKEDIKYELSVERTVKEAIKAGGYTPIAYPPMLYGLLKGLFPQVKFQNKKFIKQLIDRYPLLFKISNYA